MITNMIHRPSINQIKLVYQYLVIIGTHEQIAATIIDYSIRCFEGDHSTTDELTANNQILKTAIQKHKLLFEQLEDASTLPKSKIFESTNRIANTLHTLEPIHKYILGLRYMFDLSYYEIAELLELDSQQVKKFIFAARQNYKSLSKTDNLLN